MRGTGTLLAQTIAICTAHAKWTINGPETNEGTATIGVYMADQDIDGDGLPEILTESDNSSLRIFDADYRKEKHLQ